MFNIEHWGEHEPNTSRTPAEHQPNTSITTLQAASVGGLVFFCG
jgi:hypothetical protein